MNESSQRLRVLIVDDDPGDRHLIEMMLGAATARYHVQGAGNLAGALEGLAAGGIDLVLLDLNLPDSTGVDTLTRIRQAAPELPVVVVTGMDARETAVTSLGCGAQDYLVKGKFDAHLLNRAVDRQMANLLPRIGIMPERSLLPMMDSGLAAGWKCTGCNWRFQLENPAHISEYDSERRKTIEKLFAAHACELFAKPSISATPA